MKIALGQLDIAPNRPHKNIETMLTMIQDAKAQGADLIAFPEMVFGYLQGDKWTEENHCRNAMLYNEVLRQASHGIAIAFGNIYVDNHTEGYHPNKDGRVRKYNAAYVFQDGKPARRSRETILPPGVQPKTLLPTYRVFDDERLYFPTEDIAKDFGIPLEELFQPFLIRTRKGTTERIGFEICEDLWCEDYRQEERALNPTKMLIENGAEKIINISASPWTYGKNGARDRRIEFLRKDCGPQFKPFYYVNAVGAQNNGKNVIVFDGGSTVYNREGEPIIFSKKPYHEELMIIDDAELNQPGKERHEEPQVIQLHEAIIRGMRHFPDMIGRDTTPRTLIGLSGGIDSALSAAFAVDAFGKEHVSGITFPTHYNPQKSINAALHVAKALGIKCPIMPIEERAQHTNQILERLSLFGETGYQGKTTEFIKNSRGNVMAKERMILLSNLAAMHGAIFPCNGNKNEILRGYATLDADLRGWGAPLGDQTKTRLFMLARYFNEREGREIIPNIVLPDSLYHFDLAPSAELEENQIDPMFWGVDCALVDAVTDFQKKTITDVAQWYLEGSLEQHLQVSTALLQRWNLDQPQTFLTYIDRFFSDRDRAVFKRVQTGPIVLTSKGGYGYDIRESIMPYLEEMQYGGMPKELKTILDRFGIHVQLDEGLKQQIQRMDHYQPMEGTA